MTPYEITTGMWIDLTAVSTLVLCVGFGVGWKLRGMELNRVRKFALLANETVDAARGIWEMPKNPEAHDKFRKTLRRYDRAKMGDAG